MIASLIIQVILVITGWFLIIGNSRKLAILNESNQITQRLLTLIKEIQEAATIQWTGDKKMPPLIWDSYCAMHRDDIQDYFNHLKKLNPPISSHDYSNLKIRIRKSTTLDIERASEMSEQEKAKKIKELSLTFSSFREFILNAHTQLRNDLKVK